MRVLPADIYDTLELVALAFGGIGGGRFYEDAQSMASTEGEIPMCIGGCAAFAGGVELQSQLSHEFHLHAGTNDYNVREINERKLTRAALSGLSGPAYCAAAYKRVSWEEYTKELDIVRGEG